MRTELSPSGRPDRGFRRRWLGPAAILLVGVLGACTDAGASATSTPSSVVVQPGLPGEPATTVAPEDYTDDGSTAARWNQADVDYVTHMVAHHLQALEISALATDRAEHEQVTAIASRIYDTQGAEIHGLVAWLQEREQPVPSGVEELDGSGPRAPAGDHEAHADDADMPGMLSAEQVAELEAASGTEFDRLYLEAMIRHHQGAVDMSATVLTEGVDGRTEELAADIGAGQTAEIGRMQDILDSL